MNVATLKATPIVGWKSGSSGKSSKSASTQANNMHKQQVHMLWHIPPHKREIGPDLEQVFYSHFEQEKRHTHFVRSRYMGRLIIVIVLFDETRHLAEWSDIE
uniref:Uncharacterized protein n=1 Tax=Anopheles minimus TaxID=112268 RepID=A0A182VUK3_9DIPT